MVLTMHGGGTPQSTSQALTYVRKKAPNLRRKLDCFRARMMGKSPNVKFGIHPIFNMECGICVGKVEEEISETFKGRCIDICCL